MYIGTISGKRIESDDIGPAYQIYIGDRRFTIDESLYHAVKIGARIDALEARAITD
mgnify:CR=1 FL=1